MACPCDTGINVRTCGPFANRDDVLEIITASCKDCVGSVTLGTDPVDFCTDAFGGAMDDCCEMLFVFEGTENIWYSTDCTNWVLPGCNTCTYTINPVTYPDKSTWCAVADAAGLSTDCCKPMWFDDGTDLWFTDDCITFQNTTTRTPNALDIVTEMVTSSSAITIGSWLNVPGTSGLTITLDVDGYIMGEVSWSQRSFGSSQVICRLVESGTPLTYASNDGDNGDAGFATTAYCYGWFAAGTYTLYPQYYSVGGSSGTSYGCATRIWTKYED